MDDQHFGEDLSLEGLIEQGRVTHLCAADAQTGPDETRLLTALCAAVAGQIYRVDALTYVFRIGAEDLDGALALTPPDLWADALTDALHATLGLSAEAAAVSVRALRSETAPEGESAEAEADAIVAEEDDIEDTAAAAADLIETAEPALIEEIEADPAEAVDDDVAAETAIDAEATEAEADAEIEAEPAEDAETEAETAEDTDPEDAPNAVVAESDAEVAEVVEPPVETARADVSPHPLANFAAALTDIQSTLTAQAAASSTPAILDRIAALETGLAEMRAEMAGLAAALGGQAEAFAAQGAAAEATERRLDALLTECQDIPERAAEKLGARDDVLTPVTLALGNLLRRLDRDPQPALDFGPIEARLGRIEGALDALPGALAASDAETFAKLDGLAADVNGLPERHARDRAEALEPVAAAMAGVERQLAALAAPAPVEPPRDTEAELREAVAEVLGRLEIRLAPGAHPA